MNTKLAVRITASIALLAGLFAGPPVTAATDQGPARTTAKSVPLIKKKCVKGFRSDWSKLNHVVWVHAYDYYEGRRKAEQAMFDQMRWILADPNAHELIPGMEAEAARDRADYQPVVAQLRDSNYKALDKFHSKYLRNGCLSEDGAKVHTSGIRALRASFKDIYKAHEQLFGVNLALQTAQMDMATEYMTNADLEAATIDENWQRSYLLFRKLRYPS